MRYMIGETVSGDIAVFIKPIGMNTPGQTFNPYGFSNLPVDSNPVMVTVDKEGKIVTKKRTQIDEFSNGSVKVPKGYLDLLFEDVCKAFNIINDHYNFKELLFNLMDGIHIVMAKDEGVLFLEKSFLIGVLSFLDKIISLVNEKKDVKKDLELLRDIIEVEIHKQHRGLSESEVNKSLPIQQNVTLAVKSPETAKTDAITKSDDENVYSGVNYNLLGTFMEHWGTKEEEKDPKRQEILAVFISRYLNGVFDFFIFRPFLDKDFDVIAHEIGKFISGNNLLRSEYVKNVLIDNLFIYEDKTTSSRGRYIISDEFVNHCETVANYLGYAKKGTQPKDLPDDKAPVNWGREVRTTSDLQGD